MTLIGDVFPNITVPNDAVRSMSKKFSFTGAFKRQHGKWVETLKKVSFSDIKNPKTVC